jgi:hypothetical protein
MHWHIKAISGFGTSQHFDPKIIFAALLSPGNNSSCSEWSTSGRFPPSLQTLDKDEYDYAEHNFQNKRKLQFFEVIKVKPDGLVLQIFLQL